MGHHAALYAALHGALSVGSWHAMAATLQIDRWSVT